MQPVFTFIDVPDDRNRRRVFAHDKDDREISMPYFPDLPPGVQHAVILQLWCHRYDVCGKFYAAQADDTGNAFIWVAKDDQEMVVVV